MYSSQRCVPVLALIIITPPAPVARSTPGAGRHVACCVDVGVVSPPPPGRPPETAARGGPHPPKGPPEAILFSIYTAAMREHVIISIRPKCDVLHTIRVNKKDEERCRREPFFRHTAKLATTTSATIVPPQVRPKLLRRAKPKLRQAAAVP